LAVGAVGTGVRIGHRGLG